ncbi:MAG: hypothetical protein ACFFBD_24390 [Candidatus Hodarchaeota archaeon]
MGYNPYARIVYEFTIPDSLKTDKQTRTDLESGGCERSAVGYLRGEFFGNICVEVLLAAIRDSPILSKSESVLPGSSNT